ncbi:unnamed protein product [Nesidiocoris tenuis]|uniref:Uncharacterized protein n=1 Tax=Nesidiocoris tenuis TaxID=355587 RepID=A0A6H5H7Y4_9HEMI|nr:unnamed protein product [Nesidiocoris tenuis]
MFQKTKSRGIEKTETTKKEHFLRNTRKNENSRKSKVQHQMLKRFSSWKQKQIWIFSRWRLTCYRPTAGYASKSKAARRANAVGGPEPSRLATDDRLKARKSRQMPANAASRATPTPTVTTDSGSTDEWIDPRTLWLSAYNVNRPKIENRIGASEKTFTHDCFKFWCRAHLQLPIGKHPPNSEVQFVGISNRFYSRMGGPMLLLKMAERPNNPSSE